MSDPAIVLGHVRLHGRRADAISGRWWLERALAGAGRAAGLAPGTILIVRRLRHVPPAHRSVQRWGQGLDRRLARLARGAVRPARESVPPSCEAVLFADQAELLACLARDWLEGRVAERWWWSLRPGDGTEFLTAEWTSRATHIPAAIEALSALGLHVSFARRLGRRDVLAITRAIAQAWGAGWLAIDERAAPQPLSDFERSTPVAVVGAGRQAGEARASSVPPWRALAPALEAERLAPEREVMIGFSLLLHRSPALALAAATAAQLRRWREDGRANVLRHDDPAALEVVTSGEMESATAAGDSVRTVDRPPRLTVAVAEPTFGRPLLGADPLVPQARSGRGEGDTCPAPTVEIQPHSGRDATISQPPSTQPPPDSTAAGAHVEPLTVLRSVSVRPEMRPPELAGMAICEAHRDERDTPPSTTRQALRTTDETRPSLPAFATHGAPEMLVTEVGGILLLLNVALHLGHYGDFTSPRESGIALSPWDWLALIGRYLLPRQAGRDRVWRVLAELAGRDERHSPGAGFQPPTVWRIPPAWLALPDGAFARWSWAIHDQRLTLRHPLGFPVLDLPARGDPMHQLERELGRYRRAAGTVRLRPGRPPAYPASPRPLPPSLARWRSWVGAYVAVRLRLALGASSRSEAATQALRRPARLRCADGRLDAWFSLDELPVSVRAAGLDRDPGWIPASGLTIAFHYD